MLQVFGIISLENFIAEKKYGLCKKERKKQWTSVRDIENNGYSDAHLKKRRKEEKDSPCFLTKSFRSFKKQERQVSWSIVELG